MDKKFDSEISSINPLEIYRILQETLTFLNPRDLKNCRLVNSTWNDVSIFLLQQKQCLQFNSVKSFLKFNTAFLSEEDISSENGDKLLLPYNSCIFGSELMDPDSPDFMGFHPGALTFFTKFSQHFSELHLSLGASSNPAVRNLLQSLLLKWFTNLETLSLLLKESPFDFFCDFQTGSKLHKLKRLHVRWIGYSNDISEKFDFTDQFLTPILSMAENLETISSKMPRFLKQHDQNRGTSDAIEHSAVNDQVLQSILSFGESNSIQHRKGLVQIQFLLKTSNNQLESLTNSINLDLLTIYLELEESVLNYSVSEFFRKFKNLKKLWIEFPKLSGTDNSVFARERQNIFFAHSMHLKQMTIVNYDGYFYFLNYLPGMKTLDIVGPSFRPLIFQSDSKLVQNLSLTSLTLSSKNVISCQNIGSEISSTFPSLRSLTLHNTDNSTCKSIFQSLTQLTSLHISGKGITDEGICGESDKILRILLESAVERSEGKLSWDFNPRYASIGCLKYLQSCSIQADLITDACLIFGISKCSKLKRLQIQSTLELITKFGFASLSQLQDMESLKIYVRNFGWASLKQLREEIN